MAFDTLWMNQYGDYIALKNYVEVSQDNIDSILKLRISNTTELSY